jgi:sodium transport system ATP-binding protein
MKENAISMHSVSKSYGDLEAVKSISFCVESREIAGLIGPNGAGKTTIIRMIATLLRPDAGSISVCGIDTLKDPEGVRRIISVLPEVSGLYEKLSVLQNIELFSWFYDIDDVRGRIGQYVDLFDLRDKMDLPAGKLSLGMKKKVSIIRAISHDSGVIVLDEPFSGLAPDTRISLKKLLRIFKDEGKTILISSHELLEVENLCDKVILLDAGRIIVDDYIQALKDRFKGTNLPTLEEIYMTLRNSKGANAQKDQ